MRAGLAWLVLGLSWRWRGYAAAAAIVAVILTGLGIELGQVLLPGKYPDTTDWFLESAGGLAGYALFRMLRAHPAKTPIRRHESRRHGSGRKGST